MGDQLLKRVAERLHGCIQDTDLVARIGGDEFAIVQTAVERPEMSSQLANRIVEAISAPFDVDGKYIVIGTSIGIAVAPDDGSDPDQLLKNADMALYLAKTDGRGRHRFFEPEMDRRLQSRRTLELDLRSAIVHGEFELHYQPILNLQSNEVSGFEALIRWNNPERGEILPSQFIPLAEETGLILPLGEWVLRTACAQAAVWSKPVSVAVNLSPAQFKSQMTGRKPDYQDYSPSWVEIWKSGQHRNRNVLRDERRRLIQPAYLGVRQLCQSSSPGMYPVRLPSLSKKFTPPSGRRTA